MIAKTCNDKRYQLPAPARALTWVRRNQHYAAASAGLVTTARPDTTRRGHRRGPADLQSPARGAPRYGPDSKMPIRPTLPQPSLPWREGRVDLERSGLGSPHRWGAK